MGEETKVTVKFWAVMAIVVAVIGWLCITVFANTGRIGTLESEVKHLHGTTTDIKELVKEIRIDLKGHIFDTKNGKK